MQDELKDLDAAVQGCLSYLSLYEAHLVHGQLWHATLRAHTDGAYHGGMLLDDMGRDDAALPVLSCVCVMLSGPDCTAEQKKRAGEVLDGVILGKHGDIFNDAVSASQRSEDVDFSTLALVHVNVGRALKALRGEIDSAKKRFREASRLAGEVGDDRLKAVCDVLAKETVSDSTDA